MAVTIRVDDKACVGCSLCAEVCPTGVFEFDESRAIPEVKKAPECFGCLSCSEICPASALEHTGIPLSRNYYHDPGALRLAARIGGATGTLNAPPDDGQSIGNAVRDLGIRLRSVAAVLRQTLGQSLPAIGTQAGRSLASQLPRYQRPSSLEDALALTRETFAPAWTIGHDLQDDKLTVRIKDCFIRDVCAKEKTELGGDLCVLFYGYFAGYLSKVAGIRPRLVTVKREWGECQYAIQVHAVERE